MIEYLKKIKWIEQGQVDTDHYELFNRDNSDDLEDAVKLSEISHESVIETIKDFLSEFVSKNYSDYDLKVNTSGYGNSDKISISIRNSDSDGISFDIQDNIDYSSKDDYNRNSGRVY